MRRPFSILIVALFILAPLSALLPGSAESQLPACCRRHGAHHCAMDAALAAAPAGAPQFTAPARCPLYRAGNLAPSPVFTLRSAPASAATQAVAAIPSHASSAALFRPRIPSSRGPPSAC